ncbi:futalosine hydrolase [Streptomyces sp. NA02950]|uniref:futalosine hydrolase n=1 Tax=Streptomyces sp. NA02950 TaxID=2742137 RepID=UPI00159268DF|nr:futalosine hydrolase [Streptomyces sp. NA02950]QKV94342.1 futalosine hydrolase [Streptomyces sp. NA02950]
MRALIVTAVAAERDAVVRGLGRPSTTAPAAAEVALPGGVLHRLEWSGTSGDLTLDVLAAGVGPAAAAAGTATALTAAALAGAPYDLAVSAGIGGGFTGPATAPATGPVAPRAPLGSVVIADAVVAADLGAETPDGFAAVTDLGFGTVEHLPPADLVTAAAEAARAVRGTVLTVSTVTGSAERAAELLRRHPRAAAEAMEGFGVAEAAAAQSVPVLEVRAVSNAVGPRDRAAWRIGEALEALADAFGHIAPVLRTWTRAPARTSTGKESGSA